MPRKPGLVCGFAYLAALFLTAAIGVGLAAAASVWHLDLKREREKELLFIGGQYRAAIQSYYESSPGVRQLPGDLRDLLQDRRGPVTRRHLRRLYPDPLTGTTDWGLVRRHGRIAGVHSTSTLSPVRRTGFQGAEFAFQNAASYVDWRFIYLPDDAGDMGRRLANPQTDNPITRGLSSASTDEHAIESTALRTESDQVSTATGPTAPGILAPHEAWVCMATQANELLECERQYGGLRKPLDACLQAVSVRHRQCLDTAS